VLKSVHASRVTVPPCREQKIAQFYAPQTKILEGLTKEEIRIVEALFNGS
jgi:hypothetical protein